MAKHPPCNVCGTPAACESGCRIDALAEDYRRSAERAERARLDHGLSEDARHTLTAEMDRRDRDLAAASGTWRNRREMAEDVILSALVLIGGLTVLRWALDITGAGAWLGWW